MSKYTQHLSVQFSSVLSWVYLFVTSWTPAHQASLSITNSRSLLRLMSIESVMPSSYLILCWSLLLLSLIFPRIRVFSNEPVLHISWPTYWNFSFSISPSNEHSGLISFRMDQLDLLAVQGTLKSLLQHHSSKASILQCSTFFRVQLSLPYMTAGKTIVLTIQTLLLVLLVKNLSTNAEDIRDDLCVRKIPWRRKWTPWRRKWQPRPLFLVGESHGQKNLEGCSS